jgi:DNA-binding MarR family transcriptional regulator
MDKATVSRCFKKMRARGMIVLTTDQRDGRIRRAVLTRHGRELHDLVLEVALQREHALTHVLDEREKGTLLDLLKRLHENLPVVEEATHRFVKRRYGATLGRGRSASTPSS